VRFVLVLQWPSTDPSDHEKLLHLEQLIEKHAEGNHAVDGYDIGSGEMNIFILTDEPEHSFESVKRVLQREPNWAEARAAYRDLEEDDFTILWPKDLRSFAVA
jgi:hypothetical protein